MLLVSEATFLSITHGEVLEEEPLVITHSVSEDGFPELWRGTHSLTSAMRIAWAHLGLSWRYIWTHWELNPGPSTCGAAVVPLDRNNDPGRTRTCNPRLRRPMPYPLGHGARYAFGKTFAWSVYKNVNYKKRK